MSSFQHRPSGSGEKIRIHGLVQGVGFRPTIYRIATKLQLRGEVMNDSKGVKIIVQGSDQQIDEFVTQIKLQCPPLARIDSIIRDPLMQPPDYLEFTICSSESGEIMTGIVPDAATCPQCIEDILDSKNRRFGYAFTNCTHCGPRLSIVQQIPYDRAYTSMKHFELCPLCRLEYNDPYNRRFHAQPNACPACGPVLQLTDAKGKNLEFDNVLARAARFIQQGKIVAIKGIGGFQLACDASNDEAIKRLRERKRRPAKALALMALSEARISPYCRVSAEERELLESAAAPIVVLSKKHTQPMLSAELAPGQNTLGFMLPYSPLHHILMQHIHSPIVLTSGNANGAPQCITNEQAIDQLGHIADYFVMHNRDIVNRVDDSVVRIINGNSQFYRRARGYAPAPIPMPPNFSREQSMLALGGELKNTFCLLKNGQATLSQHMGNLEDLRTYNDYLYNLELYQQLFKFSPQAIVVDSHPEYLSSKLGRQWALDRNLPLIEIQHHHAHIASCMADNNWPLDRGEVIGVALDGLGYGDDGSVWGGEFMLADYNGYRRHACLKPLPLPGAGKAMLEPWRNTYAHLTQQQDWPEIADRYQDLALVQFLQQQPLAVLDRMIKNHVNSPQSSSCGRLFDAIAAALGICPQQISYEGQAAMELEALITADDLKSALPYPFEIEPGEPGHPGHINTAPMWPALLDDLQQGVERCVISARFHVTLAHIILRVALDIQQNTGIDSVALAGGVFQNATLLTLTHDLLSQHSFSILCHNQVPANDGGLALGQVAIAAARFHRGDI